MKTLSDKIMFGLGDGSITTKDVKEFIRELKERGLKNTLYPKYLMLTYDDLKELAGDKLI